MTVVSVGNRESDIYELFKLALSEPQGLKLLVRAERDRLLEDGQMHLGDYVAKRSAGDIRKVQISRRDLRPAHKAKLEIRFAKVMLNPPETKKHLPKLTMWAILAQEIDWPKGLQPMKWILIGTIEVDSFETAMEKLDWYTLRYWIKPHHQTLKSGCKIEQRQLDPADRIECCLAIDIVVAWRILHLTKLGRETPHVPCTVFFEDAEWKGVVARPTAT